MLKEIFKRSKREQRILCIWLYDNEDDFYCGYVKNFDEHFVYIQHFTKYGKPDGTVIEKIENIESIDFDDDYSKAMEYLIANHKLLETEENIDFSDIDIDESYWQYQILEKQAHNDETVVRIEVNGNFYSGLVKNIDENFVVINRIGIMGENENLTLFKLEDIESIRINDIENRKKLLLYKWRKLFK